MIDLERDLAEARAIVEGTTAMLPEIRHLRAMQIHFEDTLILAAIKVAKAHDDIMALE